MKMCACAVFKNGAHMRGGLYIVTKESLLLYNVVDDDDDKKKNLKSRNAAITCNLTVCVCVAFSFVFFSSHLVYMSMCVCVCVDNVMDSQRIIILYTT